ncbi:hypothetical protein G3I40_30695 [Streptomyces sp. SID14478]|uniref:hypothetical protein n=1 Tax=Streptomyces sp. SID14478 TaxID=2706073 RepID=UPI0013D98E8B|nr:hypothetical protein [Streptomyces sp. SID14478]NEB79554.1 hypothetical protein [Streptomyces sp. SID14478]
MGIHVPKVHSYGGITDALEWDIPKLTPDQITEFVREAYSMGETNHAEIQVISLESSKSGEVTCIVRCVGGTARIGQQFAIDSDQTSEGVSGTEPWRLVEIDRYGRKVDFFDPPHGARITLAGRSMDGLRERVTLKSVGP